MMSRSAALVVDDDLTGLEVTKERLEALQKTGDDRRFLAEFKRIAARLRV